LNQDVLTNTPNQHIYTNFHISSDTVFSCSDLAFLPDVILCCVILHNILLGQTPDEVEHLLSILRSEGLKIDVPSFNVVPPPQNTNVVEDFYK